MIQDTTLCHTMMLTAGCAHLFLFAAIQQVTAQGVSCTFQADQCGWADDDNMTLHWQHDACHQDCNKGNFYMSLKMERATANETGRLLSPWLDDAVDQTCLLNFDYHLARTDTCQISVLLRTTTGVTLLWRTSQATGHSFRDSPDVNLTIPCTGHRYQIVLEGRKLSDKPCGGLFNEIDIDNVEYHQYIPSTTPSTTSSMTTTTTMQTGPTNTTETAEGKPPVSCTFQADQCGWTDDDNMTLHWQHDACHQDCNKGNFYMSLKMERATANETGRLLSPWLDDAVDQTCLLNFDYHLARTDTCQISVLLRTTTGVTLLWRTSQATGHSFRDSPDVNLTIPCTGHRYQIILEGKKLSDEPCGGLFNEIDVDNVEYHQYIPSTTPSTTPSKTLLYATTTTSTVTSSAKPTTTEARPRKMTTTVKDKPVYQAQTERSECVSPGTFAGVIVIIVAIFIGAFTALHVWRRRSRGGGGDDMTFSLVNNSQD